MLALQLASGNLCFDDVNMRLEDFFSSPHLIVITLFFLRGLVKTKDRNYNLVMELSSRNPHADPCQGDALIKCEQCSFAMDYFINEEEGSVRTEELRKSRGTFFTNFMKCYKATADEFSRFTENFYPEKTPFCVWVKVKF